MLGLALAPRAAPCIWRSVVVASVALGAASCATPPVPEATLAPTSSHAAAEPTGAPLGPGSPNTIATARNEEGLAGTCAVQWAASLASYADAEPESIAAVLASRSGTAAPSVRP